MSESQEYARAFQNSMEFYYKSRYQISLEELKARIDSLTASKAKLSTVCFDSYSFDLNGNKAALFPVEIKAPNGFLLVVFALDENGQLVGHRRQGGSIEKDPITHNEYLLSEGYISVEKRGQGLGHAISKVTDDLLQRIANDFYIPVVWRATNSNKQQLEKDRQMAESMAVSVSPQAARDFVLESEKEQERWQSIYKDGGLLGFKNLRKEYEPQAELEAPEAKVLKVAEKVGDKYEFQDVPVRETDRQREQKFKEIIKQINQRLANANNQRRS